jgi:hypothetical protein
MTEFHRVVQGDCLASIAKRYGFADWRVLYGHDDNEELRKARPNPHLLLPGDCVAIPAKREKRAAAVTFAMHSFRLALPKVWVRLAVLDGHGGSGVQARYELELEGSRAVLRGDIGADGNLDVRVPADACRGRLTLRDPVTDLAMGVFLLEIGGLDPGSTISGVRQRLNRLGFACRSGDGPMDATTESALRAFQRRYALTEDGTINDATRERLESVAGV